MNIAEERAVTGHRLGRRRVLAGLGGLLAAGGLTLPSSAKPNDVGLQLGSPVPYSFAGLCNRARVLAEAPYKAPRSEHDALLETIGFDAYQTIRYKPNWSLWQSPDTGAPVRFFHQGRYFKLPVAMYEVADGEAREIVYTPRAFQYEDSELAVKLIEDLGFAGFRLMDPDGESDWLAFLGASYFRSAGPEGQYGISARGLGIDTGLSTPEEFPRFSAFWLHRPSAGARILTVDALLESESCAGAYRFRIMAADTITLDVTAQLHVRKKIERLGIAPLTSMYWYSETDRRFASDWRPEVHDSDGLALWTGPGERIWRPLNNPSELRVSSFADENPRGFGLLQRDRQFFNYEDDGAFYNRRPGVWVEPLGQWGRGEVQLTELPTDDEIHDNIVAHWKPERPVLPGNQLDFSYRLHWISDEPFPPTSVGSVVATRMGRGGIPGQPRPPGVVKFVIDVEGGRLDNMEQRYDIEPVVSASRGRVENGYVIKVVGTPRWRMVFDLAEAGGAGAAPVELRAFMRLGDTVLSETWLYQYLPFDMPA